MSDIFISYARSTAREAEAMGAALRALGYSVWRDTDLPSHRSYSDVIEEQLGVAKTVLVVWSTEAVRSQWVRSEADRARGQDKLVQLAVDKVSLPMPFDQIQCADLTGWSGEADHPGWIKTLASIGALAGGGAAAAAPTRAPDGGLMAVLAAEVEGIGLLLLNHRVALDEALQVCASAFRADAEARGGTVFREGDGVMMAAFASPEAAMAAAIQAQGALAGRAWPGVGVLKVRMAVHYGPAEPRGRDYFGPALNRVTPLLALAQGEQILVTGAVAEPLSGKAEFSFKPLGAHALEDPLTKVGLFQTQAAGLKADFAPIATEDAVQVGNLPRRQGALIGREADLAQIAALFESADLVTVTGTGGVGKTRIAIEYAHQRQGQHEDGVWLVELAPLANPEQVTGAIARAIGVALPPVGDPVQALVARLRPRDCLIVLDNCEHVIDAVAAIAEAALEQAPKVKLLASSQELIGVEGERVFRLRSLGEPDAVALFTERAKAADAAFAMRGRDAAAVSAICQRLDGIPLAIEMAAARAPSLGCEGVLQRLDDRFRILTGGRRTALPRQRTLQATLDWSHGLLSPEDAAVFRRLGVFTGGFSLEAASRVAADDTLDTLEVIDALSSLVAKSLATVESEDNRTRYRLLETTRMYALERLAEADETAAVQRRHAGHFADFTENSRIDYYRLPDEAFFARYAADLDNIERAMDWAFGPDGDDELGLRLTTYSWTVWVGLSRGAQYLPWSDLALSRITPRTPSRLALLVRRSAVSVNMTVRPMMAPALAEQILPELRDQNDPTLPGDTLWSLTVALILVGRHAEAALAQAEAAALVANLAPSRLTFGVRHAGALLAYDAGDLAGAVARWEAGAEQALAIGAYGWANMQLGSSIAFDVERAPDVAISQLRDMLARNRPSHMFAGQTTVQATYGLAYFLARRGAPGDVDEAYVLARATEKVNGRAVPPNVLAIPVFLALGDGRPKDAARLFGYGAATRAAMGVNFTGSREFEREARSGLVEALPEAELDALMAEGARLAPEQHFALAVKLKG